MNTKTLVIALTAATALSASAAVTAVEFDPTSGTVNSISLSGILHTPASFIDVTMTGFTDSTAAQYLTHSGTGSGSAVPSSTIGDRSLHTGPANFDTLELTFLNPLTNDGSTTLVFFDISATNDAFSITANGNTIDRPAATQEWQTGSGATGRFPYALHTSSNPGATNTPAEFDAESYPSTNATANSQRNALSIPLADFGLAPGETVNAITITATGYDPVAVIAIIPEPSTALLATLGALAFLVRRRR